MTRLFTLCPAVALLCVASSAVPLYAQSFARPQPLPVTRVAAVVQADLRGVVLDERGTPVQGAVVSALGSASAFVVSDRDGRFTFRNLPAGPYLVRAHLQGYTPARGQIIQVSRSSREISTIALRRRAGEPAAVLTAGVGPAEIPEGTTGDGRPGTDDHSEVAWRLRHLKRGVLKQSTSLIDLGGAATFQADPQNAFMAPIAETFSGLRAGSARIASALFSDLPVSGQINLLTRTSFDGPQSLFSADNWRMPSGIAYVSLEAPTTDGDWSMRGAMTEGDVSSWIVSSSFVRTSTAVHRYETGTSYGVQRYMIGNADALAAASDSSRTVGAVYAYDTWSITPQITLSYGGKYASYGYMADRGQFSPRASLILGPDANHVKFRATLSRRALAPGAEEFLPPATGLWLPPERTFSPVSPRLGFSAERVDHAEIAAERDVLGDFMVGMRVFRQRVDDQLVTLFGVARPDTPIARAGHYYVGSGGDFTAIGWGVSLSGNVGKAVRASVDYTQADTAWGRRPIDDASLARLTASLLPGDDALVHDLTTSFESVIPTTATRLFVAYKVNTAFADDRPAGQRGGARFDVQVTQSLPFMRVARSQWEMLFGVRNLFREELLDASVYDELLVVRPPKRIIGGLTVRF
jgi:hypothetical protein